LRNKISTPQSSWIEMEGGSGTEVALEDGSGPATLGGDVEQRLKIAAVALGGVGRRRTCNNGSGASIVKAQGLLLQHWRQRW
jgi:hypothetical protein